VRARDITGFACLHVITDMRACFCPRRKARRRVLTLRARRPWRSFRWPTMMRRGRASRWRQAR
jgi:hypothetical protein